MKKEKSVKEFVLSTLTSVKHVLDSTEMIGNPIKVSERETIIPISKLTFGFGIGGSDLNASDNKNNLLFEYGSDNPMVGGSLGGVSIHPEAFLYIKDGDCNLIRMKENKTIYDRLFEVYKDFSKYMSKGNKKNSQK